MRTFKDIYKDFCDWYSEKTNDPSKTYENLLDKYQDEKLVNSMLYKTILEMCYNVNNGLFYFCKFIIGDLKEIGFPRPFRYNKLLRDWDKKVKLYKQLAILCARGHGKSLFFTQILTIYDMFLFKHRRMIVISASQEQANRLLEEMKTVVENNEWLIKKKNPLKWASQTIGYNDGFVLVAGIGSEIRGHHVDRIILDDILRSDNKLKDIEVEDFIDMTLAPMVLNRKGQILLVGTPIREKDIFGTIANRINTIDNCPWKIFKYPAIIDYEKKILQCPDRFTWKDIMDKRLSMGSLKFAREYQLEFFSRDNSLFPKRIIDPARAKGKDICLETKKSKRTPNWMYVMGVDVARSGSVSADFTVAIVLAYDTISQEKQIVHMWREKGLKITEQAYHISKLAKDFGDCMVVVETNNMGQEMVDQLIDDYNVFVEPFTVSGHAKKDELIRFLIRSFETEQITMPQGNQWSRDTMNILEDELAKFCVTITPAGNERFEGMGSHDDCVMGLALANKGTQIGGIPFAVKDFEGKHYTGDYNSFTNQNTSNETDLVKQIQMGLIK